MSKLFGTDGIRARVGEYPLTEDALYKLGAALGVYVKALNPHKRKNQKIALIKDTRDSGSMLEETLTKGITSCGVDAIRLGIMPTPSLSFLIRQQRYDLGVVISASHNAATDNGLKFFSHKGYKLFPAEEAEIERILFEEVIPQAQVGGPQGQEVRGRIKDKDLKGSYVDFLKNIVSGCDTARYKIVADCAFGVASLVAPSLFRDIAKEPVILNDDFSAGAINQACGSLHPEVVSKAVLENNADCGFAFDGDADRVIACDEKGRIRDGDYIMAVIGDYLRKRGLLRKNSIVATYMSNIGLDMCVGQWNGRLLKTEVGDKLVLEKMLSAKLNLGGEQSGHIIPLDYTSTGDGILTSLLLLKIMHEEGKPLSALSGCMYKFPQVLININVNSIRPLNEMPKLGRLVSKHEARLGSSGRIYIRYSGTESKRLRIMVEGQDQLQIKDIAEALASTAREELNA